MPKQSNKISIDFDEIKKNIKASALLAANQLSGIVSEVTKKAQKDLSEAEGEVAKQISKLVDVAKHTSVQDILNSPQVKKIVANPRVQEFLNNEKVREFLNNPKIKQAKEKFSAKAQEVQSKVKKTAKKAKSNVEKTAKGTEKTPGATNAAE